MLLSSRLRSSIPTRLSELGDVIRFIGLHGRTQLQHLNMLNYRSCGACMDLSSMYMSRRIIKTGFYLTHPFIAPAGRLTVVKFYFSTG